ncbi:MAG: UDP-N-acetylmuramate dehydrogenase [Candidatus Electronema aureum]|uniref:UDP-N-acetylenolpyruvoylglucosamine reductase n=1 Tax=Candidatus Electronema aureum TaxID=2005002 RepID=A0A521G3B5_9BACT|nr:MAG: UDP-N-acetylmuramate dehydrogenase [Candidatus Electronema aureum]
MNERQLGRLAAAGLAELRFDAPMAEYCTLRAGGKVAALIEVANLEELRRVLALLAEEEIKFLIVGRGSNLLVVDSGYSGAIIRLKGEFNTIALQECNEIATIIKVGAGCALGKLVSWCSGQGLAGLEFLVGIPGSVGGAVRMNAGAWGQEIGARLEAIELIDRQGKLRQIPFSGLRLSYRTLDLAEGRIDNTIITAALFSLKTDREEDIRSRCAAYLERRKGKQPAGVASAGSFFKNPPDDFAGRLIEVAGLKGTSCGAAMISPVHGNFLVNTGGASATDILTLMEQVQAAVFAQFAIKLEPEVRIIQENDSP